MQYFLERIFEIEKKFTFKTTQHVQNVFYTNGVSTTD